MTKPDKTRQRDGLTPAQIAAVDLVAQGQNDQAVADAVGVTRQTVNGWRNRDLAFVASVNARRRELWEDSRERLRVMADKAVAVLDRALDMPTLQAMPAAVAVLKAVKDLPPPSAPTTTEGVLRARAEAAVAEEDKATPATLLDMIHADDEKPARVREAMQRLRGEG